jgi:drug/metabolite transporter (DMT)-like permease
MADRILPGVALMLGFVATAPLIDVFSKLAAETVPVAQVTAARFLVQGLVMLPVAVAAGHGLGMARDVVGPVLLRALMLVLSTFAFVSAIDVMPLADALAIVFVMPFILLLLGRVVMGDQVGPRRIAACAVGFGGCLLVIQPSLAAFGLVALWPLGTAASFAVYMLVTRSLSARMHPVPMQLQTSALAFLICLPVLLWGEGTGRPTFDPVWPEGRVWGYLAGVGAASALSHMMMTVALRFAPSATLAPLNYLEIVVAVILGFLVFGEFPNAPTWAGIAVIVGSGLYVIQRERVVASEARAAALPSSGAGSRAGG